MAPKNRHPKKIHNHFPSKQTDTPPKTNISAENQWLEDENSVWNGPLLGDEKPTGGHKQDAKKLTMIPWAQGPQKSKSHQIGIQVGWKTDTSHDWFLVWNNCYIICYQNIPSFTKHVPIRIYTIEKSCTFWTPKVMGLVDWNMIFQIANGWCLSEPSQMGPISLPNSTTFWGPKSPVRFTIRGVSLNPFSMGMVYCLVPSCRPAFQGKNMSLENVGTR